MDLINALFEMFGAVVGLFNIRVLLKDREIKGVSFVTLFFFASWGLWNVFYYPTLEQWLSTIAAVFLAGTNMVYLGMAIYFTKKKNSS